jgi:hypothetical protein
MLSLSNTARLPTLANNCYIVGEAKRADVIWSEGDFKALCEHMLNENPLSHFLNVWIDAKGQARFTKAPLSRRADRRASWAWGTITGKAKGQTGIGFYPSNPEGQSRWAALDFDAHNGEHEQARKWSLEAFSLLLQNPQVHLILCTSGNGFHLFIITRELQPLSAWIVLLKQLCELIGAPIADGSCEIFPNERAESQPVGKAIRAPGTWNPKTNTFSLIEAETVKPLLKLLPRGWSSGVGKLKRVLPRNSSELSLHKSTDNYSFTQWSISTKPLVDKILARYPIARQGTRHGVLVQLVGHLSKKFGRQAAQRIVEEHYRLNERNIRSTLDEHLRDFSTAWDGMCKKLVSELSAAEKEAFNRLKTEHQREGFLIVRAFAGAADHKKQRDFAISQASLADRLIVTGPGAGDVIRKLCKEEIIAPTQDYVRHKHSARFRWVLPHPTDRATSSTSSPPGLDSLSAPLLTGAQKDMPQLPQVAGAFEAK